jgi:hypothetical protein
VARKRGGKYEGKFRDVVENTCRKNVGYCLSTMLLKITHLNHGLHDVYDKKGCYRKFAARERRKQDPAWKNRIT